MRFKFITYCLLNVITTFQLFGQNYNSKTDSKLLQRNSDAVLLQNRLMQPISSTRFLPVFYSSGMGNWTIPSQQIMVDGFPYRTFSLGLASVDLLPLDVIITDSIEIETHPSIKHGHSSPGGIINFNRKPIPDSLEISSRFFIGSETGDPIIHLYTQPNAMLYNRNKTGLSGAGYISNSYNKLKVRVAGGTFFYFNTGFPDNDRNIFFYDRDRYSKQNRQLTASAEAEYSFSGNSRMKIFSGILNQLGWERTPVTSLYSFIDGTSFTVRTKFENIIENLDVDFISDKSIILQESQVSTEAGKYSMSYKSVEVGYRFQLNDNITLKTIPGFMNEYISPEDNLTNIIAEKASNNYYYVTANIEHRLNKNSKYNLYVRGEKYNGGECFLSSEFNLEYSFHSSNKISARLFSIASSPGVFERYTSFTTSRKLQNGVEKDFTIKGNKDLGLSRTSGGVLSYKASTSNNFLFSCELFYNKINKPLDLYSSEVFISLFPGDIVRNATYENFPDREIKGMNFHSSVSISERLLLNNSYSYTDNTDVRFTPKHLAHSSLEVTLPYSLKLFFSVLYSSETYWEHFVVRGQNDHLNQTGFNGVLNEAFIVNSAFQYSLGKVFLIKNLTTKCEITNLFNRIYRYMPSGNRIDTSVMIYILADF